jgi:hypothetical protein
MSRRLIIGVPLASQDNLFAAIPAGTAANSTKSTFSFTAPVAPTAALPAKSAISCTVFDAIPAGARS